MDYTVLVVLRNIQNVNWHNYTHWVFFYAYLKFKIRKFYFLLKFINIFRLFVMI